MSDHRSHSCSTSTLLTSFSVIFRHACLQCYVSRFTTNSLLFLIINMSWFKSLSLLTSQYTKLTLLMPQTLGTTRCCPYLQIDQKGFIGLVPQRKDLEQHLWGEDDDKEEVRVVQDHGPFRRLVEVITHHRKLKNDDNDIGWNFQSAKFFVGPGSHVKFDCT